ncbi:MAG: hypothetical protein ACREI3_11135 [Nitrospirales bacterium]
MQGKVREELRGLLKGSYYVLHHLVFIGLSATIAVSLPKLAEAFLELWSFLQHDGRFLLYAEIGFGGILMALFNYLARSTQDRSIAQMATHAGFLGFFAGSTGFVKRRITKRKVSHGLARTVMIIGSTGHKSMVDPQGDLHAVLKTCLEAKILLLNPFSDGARRRARTLDHLEMTPESLGAQVRLTIDFLRTLKVRQKNIRLKLYSEVPHVKLTILGEHIWLQHYHSNLDVQAMPEYLFSHNQRHQGLYTLFYEYFVARWENPEVPEYDLETDELVYWDRKGFEKRRERFNWSANPLAMPPGLQEPNVLIAQA